MAVEWPSEQILIENCGVSCIGIKIKGEVLVQKIAYLLVIGTSVLLAEAWEVYLTLNRAVQAGQQDESKEKKSFKTKSHFYYLSAKRRCAEAPVLR